MQLARSFCAGMANHAAFVENWLYLVAKQMLLIYRERGNRAVLIRVDPIVGRTTDKKGKQEEYQKVS
jgi:hypothetical protein